MGETETSKEIRKRAGRFTVERGLLSAILILQIAILALLWVNRAGQRGVSVPAPVGGLSRSASFTVTDQPARERVAPAATGDHQPPRRLPPGYPLVEARRVLDQFDSIFAAALAGFPAMPFLDAQEGDDAMVGLPAMDMREHGDAYTVVISLPGARPDDVHVDLFGRLLSVRALLRERRGPREITQGFERQIRLPSSLGEKPTAAVSLTNGLLRIWIPKSVSPVVPVSYDEPSF